MRQERFNEPHKLGLERLTGDNTGLVYANERSEVVTDEEGRELLTLLGAPVAQAGGVAWLRHLGKLSRRDLQSIPQDSTTDAKSVADPTPIFANSASAVSASESWLIKARSRALKRLAGKNKDR